MNKYHVKPGPAKASKRSSARKSANGSKRKTGIVVAELGPINARIPFNRNFIKSDSFSKSSRSQDQSLIKNLRRNVKGLFESSKAKGIEKEELIRLRTAVGNLKSLKAVAADQEDDPGAKSDTDSRPKSKKELLEEKRKALGEQSKTTKKNTAVGMRIEIEKLKKKFPDDPNLAIMSAILTSKDTASVSQSADDRINSLYAAIQEAGSVVMTNFLTTYSIDVLCDIYFLYLEALKTKFLGELRTVKASESDTLRRDIRLINYLLEQKRLGKTITNVAKKLDGFGYPFESFQPLHAAKSLQASNEEGDTKIGPGTVKLNKFLLRIYLNVFSQIPMLQPLARKFCDALPSNRTSRALIASVNIENAIVKLRIAKLNKSLELPKMIMSIYNYGKSFIGTNFAETVNSAVEAKLLLRIGQMVEELAMTTSVINPDIITYAYNCSTIALHYYKEEAEFLIKHISDIAARQQMELN